MFTDKPVFEPSKPYRLKPSVSLRAEQFGALLYDFETRRLSFLKTEAIANLVRMLESQPDVDAALDTAAVSLAERPHYLMALAGLAERGIIQIRK